MKLLESGFMFIEREILWRKFPHIEFPKWVKVKPQLYIWTMCFHSKLTMSDHFVSNHWTWHKIPSLPIYLTMFNTNMMPLLLCSVIVMLKKSCLLKFHYTFLQQSWETWHICPLCRCCQNSFGLWRRPKLILVVKITRAGTLTGELTFSDFVNSQWRLVEISTSSLWPLTGTSQKGN